jgi:hypothetical protein
MRRELLMLENYKTASRNISTVPKQKFERNIRPI